MKKAILLFTFLCNSLYAFDTCNPHKTFDGTHDSHEKALDYIVSQVCSNGYLKPMYQDTFATVETLYCRTLESCDKERSYIIRSFMDMNPKTFPQQQQQIVKATKETFKTTYPDFYNKESQAYNLVMAESGTVDLSLNNTSTRAELRDIQRESSSEDSTSSSQETSAQKFQRQKAAAEKREAKLKAVIARHEGQAELGEDVEEAVDYLRTKHKQLQRDVNKKIRAICGEMDFGECVENPSRKKRLETILDDNDGKWFFDIEATRMQLAYENFDEESEKTDIIKAMGARDLKGVQREIMILQNSMKLDEIYLREKLRDSMDKNMLGKYIEYKSIAGACRIHHNPNLCKDKDGQSIIDVTPISIDNNEFLSIDKKILDEIRDKTTPPTYRPQTKGK